MSLPPKFLKYANFELAFYRVVKGQNKDYKRFYRHLFAPYHLALKENLRGLIHDIQHGYYQPKTPTVIYQPKKSGVLRPITLLSLTDLIVYQAITNVVAENFRAEQKKYAYEKSFSGIYTGDGNTYFFRSWKISYGLYTAAVGQAFKAGNHYVADFDLVSFYELIDHNLLQHDLSRKVRSKELLDFLFRCLSAWTSDHSGANLRHGIPQGPEASSFIADCFLFHFDSKSFNDTVYLRYADDIKLMAKSEVPVRRALMQLDLTAKELGLIPQAQKISCRKTETLEEIQKTVPSLLLEAVANNEKSQQTQKELLKTFRGSIHKQGSEWVIGDLTKFKYCLLRLKPRKDVLKRITPMLLQSPDCAYHLATYLKKFPDNADVANLILNVLEADPIYDSSAAAYIEAMDVCEPRSGNQHFRNIIKTINRKSVEKSILLDVAVKTFKGRRCGPKDAAQLIESEKNPIARGILLNNLFGTANDAPYKLADCEPLLNEEVNGEDPDVARFCAALLLSNWPWFEGNAWHPTAAANDSVKVLATSLGLRRRSPSKQSVLDVFFKSMKIKCSIVWKKALSSDWRDAERRCLRFQEFQAGDPTARIMSLDTFNEVLLQNFSANHPALKVAYLKAAGQNLHPDLGNWLKNGAFVRELSTAAKWFSDVHDARVKSDLAHAKAKSGKATKPINYRQADYLTRRSKVAWEELFQKWESYL